MNYIEMAQFTFGPKKYKCLFEKIRNDVLEEAAKTCDALAELNRKAETNSMWEQEECSAAIRSLKTKEKQ